MALRPISRERPGITFPYTGWTIIRLLRGWPPGTPLRQAQVFSQEKPSLPSADDIEIPISIEIDNRDLHASTHPAAVINNVPNPFHAAVSWIAFCCRRGCRLPPLVPVKADRLTLTGIRSVMREVALAGYEVRLPIAVQIYEQRCVCLGPGVVNYVLNPMSVCSLLIPRQSVVVRHSGKHVLAAIPVYIQEVHIAERSIA